MENAQPPPRARDRQDAGGVVALPRVQVSALAVALATLDEHFNGTLAYQLARFLHSQDLFSNVSPLEQAIVLYHHAHGQFIRSALDKGKELSEKAVVLFEGLLTSSRAKGSMEGRPRRGSRR